MELTRKAALRLVRTSFILLCKLLLVDVICSFVGDWLVYFLLIKGKHVPKKDTSMHRDDVRSQQDPGIQVIICGISRSGSLALQQAIDILGFPCFHGFHLSNPTTAKLYLKAQASGSHQDWERLLHGYRSIADYPAASSYKLLMEMYPNAKIILNTRDPESWYNSFSQTLLKCRQTLVFQVVQPSIERCATIPFYQKLFKDKIGNKELSITNYKLHTEDVKRHVPSHKLYVLEIEKNAGWDPLCNFLKVPVPNVQFPFSNKRESFNTNVIKKNNYAP